MNIVYNNNGNPDGLMIKRLILMSNDILILETPIIQNISDQQSQIILPDNSKVFKSLSDASKGIVNIDYKSMINLINFDQVFYEEIKKETANEEFLSLIIDGILNYELYTYTLIHSLDHYKISPQAFYSFLRTKKDFLIKDTTNELFFRSYKTSEFPYYKTFKNIINELAISTTSSILASSLVDKIPFSSSTLVDSLVVNRIKNFSSNPNASLPSLNYNIIESVLPDEALNQLSIYELLEFRNRTQDLYDAWFVESIKIMSRINDDDSNSLNYLNDVQAEIFKIKREIEKIRDELFINIISSLKTFTISTITSGTIFSISFEAAIASFLAANFKTPHKIDEIIKIIFKLRNAKKDNGYSYLLNLKKINSM